MGGGKAEGRVVAAERCEPPAGLADGPGEGRRRPGSGRPSRGGSAAPRRDPRGRASRASVRSRPIATSSGSRPARRAASCSSASSTSGDSTGSSIRGARNGQPSSSATATAGSSSRLVRARTARVDPSSGQDSSTRRRRTVSSLPSGASTRLPFARVPALIRFAKRSRLCSTSRTARSTTGGGQRWFTSRSTRRSPGSSGREAKHAADVGEPPAVDALVVVADEEDAVRGRREQQGEPELCPVDVLDLVDEQLAAAPAPACQEPSRRSDSTSIARRTRSSKSRPPVAATARS